MVILALVSPRVYTIHAVAGARLFLLLLLLLSQQPPLFSSFAVIIYGHF